MPVIGDASWLGAEEAARAPAADPVCMNRPARLPLVQPLAAA
jgi:hypothetical protein